MALFLRLVGCSLALGACGVSANLRLPPQQGTDKVESMIRDSDLVDLGHGSPTRTLGELRLRPEACQGIELRPDYSQLRVQNLIAFLQSGGFEVKETRARGDLSYLDLMSSGGPVRLRVATLDSAGAAGRDLHQAILEHGPGSWGVHRSNLAVLAPIADIDDMLAFALKTRLACWGVLTVAGRDDSFVVPGGYTEL
ncbi:MAG TPA: hypothetical protein VGI10_14465 [Polyangiaceae bacterium]|jgi:hypothetical protein